MKAGGVHRRIPSRIDAAQSLPRHGAGFRAGKHRRCADERMFVSEPEGLLQVRAAHRALLGRTHVRQHARECQRLAERRPYGSGRRRPLPGTRQRRIGMAAMPTDAKASGRASHAGGAKADRAWRTRPKGRQRARDRRGRGTAVRLGATRSRAVMCGLRLPSIEPAVHEGHQAVGCGDAGGDCEDRQPCERDAIEERTRRDVA